MNTLRTGILMAAMTALSRKRGRALRVCDARTFYDRRDVRHRERVAQRAKCERVEEDLRWKLF